MHLMLGLLIIICNILLHKVLMGAFYYGKMCVVKHHVINPNTERWFVYGKGWVIR